MSNPDQMVPVGEPARDVDGRQVTVRRDYGDAIVFGHRLDAGGVAWLRARLDEWDRQRAAFIGGLDEDERACWR